MLRLKEAMRSINDRSDQRFDSQRTEVSLNELLICNLRENTTVQELFSKFTNTYNIEKNSSELIFKKIAWTTNLSRIYIPSSLPTSNPEFDPRGLQKIQPYWTPAVTKGVSSLPHCQ